MKGGISLRDGRKKHGMKNTR